MSSMPGSVSITTGSGRREAGGVDSCTDYRLGCTDLLCNSGAQGLKFFRAAEPENPPDAAPSPVEQDRVGQAAVVIDRPHPRTTHQNRKRRPKLADEGEHLAEVEVV